MNPALQQRNQSLSYPAITGKAPVERVPPAIIQFATLALDASGQIGDSFVFNAEGDFVFIESISLTSAGIITPGTGTVNVGPRGRPGLPVTGNKKFIRFKNGFTALTLKNTSASPVSIRIFTGYGDMEDFGLGTSGDVVSTAPFGGTESEAVIVRPANVTPYTVGDVIGNQAAATNNILRFDGLFRPDPASTSAQSAINGKCKIVKARIEKTSAVLLNANFSLLILQAQAGITVPTDNAPFAYVGGVIGKIDFPSFVTFGAGSTSALGIGVLPFPLNVFNSDFATYPYIKGVLIANAGYVPASEEEISVYLTADDY